MHQGRLFFLGHSKKITHILTSVLMSVESHTNCSTDILWVLVVSLQCCMLDDVTVLMMSQY